MTRAWQRMLSGRRLDLLDPTPMDIEIEDIALGLARNTRWNGQTSGDHGWSVAQHSDFVVDIVRRLEPRAGADVLMAAKLHDAPEYVIGDMISPFKAVLGDSYKDVEARLAYAIHARFGLPADERLATLSGGWRRRVALAGRDERRGRATEQPGDRRQGRQVLGARLGHAQ